MAKIIIRLPTGSDLKDLFANPLQAAAVSAVSLIQRRTARGVDLDGRAFAPYSEGYARAKALSGRRSTPPDLTLTGQMLRNLKVKSRTNTGFSEGLLSQRVLIGVEGQHRDTRLLATGKQPKASNPRTQRGWRPRTLKRLPTTTPMAVVVASTHRRRPWFGVRMPVELQQLARVFQRALDQEIRRRNAQAQKALPARRTA